MNAASVSQSLHTRDATGEFLKGSTLGVPERADKLPKGVPFRDGIRTVTLDTLHELCQALCEVAGTCELIGDDEFAALADERYNAVDDGTNSRPEWRAQVDLLAAQMRLRGLKAGHR